MEIHDIEQKKKKLRLQNSSSVCIGNYSDGFLMYSFDNSLRIHSLIHNGFHQIFFQDFLWSHFSDSFFRNPSGNSLINFPDNSFGNASENVYNKISNNLFRNSFFNSASAITQAIHLLPLILQGTRLTIS